MPAPLRCAADSELEQLKDRLGVLAAPEQFFGGNALVLRHEPSGVALRFDVLGALQGGRGGGGSPREMRDGKQRKAC